MGWPALLRLTSIFGVFFLVLPAWAHGGNRRSGRFRSAAEAFVRLSFVLQGTLLLLGLIRMALPGVIAVGYAFWLFWEIRGRRPDLIRDSRSRSIAAVRVIEWFEGLRIRQCLRLVPERIGRSRAWGRAAPWLILTAAVLVARGWFPAHNLRLTEFDAYSRALSLEVLAAGHSWHFDPAVPLLLPVMLWSALPATFVIALAGPVFAALFAAATGLAGFEYTGSRLAAFLAAGFAALSASRIAALDGSVDVEMAACFAILAVGLMPRARRSAFLAAVTGGSVSVAPAVCVWLIAGLGSLLLAVWAARCARNLPLRRRPVVTAAAAAVFAAAICARIPDDRPDGPFQYEAAARMSEYIARSYPRNTWLIVSPAQELPSVYGRGWHMELTDFVASFSTAQVSDPEFRFPYPVADAFFFVERQPLWPSSPGSRIALARVDVWLDPIARSYSLPLARAGMQFEAAELLSAFAATHSRMEVAYSSPQLTVYHVALN